MRRFSVLFLFLIFTGGLFAQLVVVAEAENYQRTSTYKEVVDFCHQAALLNPQIRLVEFAQSSEGRMIPLLVLSEEKIASPGEMLRIRKPTVLIMANIHAGEVEGKEAVQFLLRDFVAGKLPDLLKGKIVLILPIFNVDGNDRFGKNRRDNGPELAGVRHNGQNLDLNRDYCKLETPEISALVKLFNEWDPWLVIDLHTTNGSYHRHTVTYSTGTNPNINARIQSYMWEQFFPEVSVQLKKSGFPAVPYGNFIKRDEPAAGWYNDASEFRYGSNYVALRNRLAILDENYSYAPFKERVAGCYALLLAALKTFSRRQNEIAQLLLQADLDTINSYPGKDFFLEFLTDRLFSFRLQSWEFTKKYLTPEEKNNYPPWVGDFIMNRTDRQQDYQLDYLVHVKGANPRPVPEGYLIEAVCREAIRNLQKHGIVLEEIIEAEEVEAGSFQLSSFEAENTLNQGHFLLRLKGEFKKQQLRVKPGMIYASVRQPLGRLLVQLLHPEAVDSLARWGFFNRFLFQQWSGRFNYYPVYELYTPLKLKKKVISIQRD